MKMTKIVDIEWKITIKEPTPEGKLTKKYRE